MSVNYSYALTSILIISLVTFGIRITPFIFFGKSKSTPKYITYLGRYLPPAVMSMLIIYCLRNVNFTKYPFGYAEIIGVATVVILHLWKRNNLISILGGTAVYMLLVH